MEQKHPFTEKGLGEAPFTLLRVEKRSDIVNMCYFCGTPLVWCYVIRSADDKYSIVGCECVKRCDPKLRKSLGAIMRKYRLDGAHKILENALVREELAAQPHRWTPTRTGTMLEWVEHGLGRWAYAKDRDAVLDFLLEKYS